MTEERIAGSVFRADHPDHTDLSQTIAASREEPGRFNTSRFGAIYLSREPETAINELRRNNGHVEHPCALFVVSLSAEKILDLSDDDERTRWQLTHEDLVSDDLTRCREVAESAVREGIEVILWPSATGSGCSLAVFAEHLRQESRVEIVHSFEMTPSAIASIIAGAPVTALHPMVRSFPSISTRGDRSP